MTFKVPPRPSTSEIEASNHSIRLYIKGLEDFLSEISLKFGPETDEFVYGTINYTQFSLAGMSKSMEYHLLQIEEAFLEHGDKASYLVGMNCQRLKQIGMEIEARSEELARVLKKINQQ